MKEAGKETSKFSSSKTLTMLADSAISDEDPLIRKHAIYLIGMARNPDCIPTLIQALKDPEKEVRSQATQSLVMMGKPASGQVIACLNDPDWKVRYRAAEVLGLIGDEKAVKPLIDALTDSKDHVRYMAAKSLGMLRNPSASKPLQDRLSDENTYVMKMASKALEDIEK
jgi:HEAT repeat protein